jgi:hypothetical protein
MAKIILYIILFILGAVYISFNPEYIDIIKHGWNATVETLVTFWETIKNKFESS